MNRKELEQAVQERLTHRPDPLEPNLAPGGVVFQSWVAGQLVHEDRMTDDLDIQALGERAGARAIDAMNRLGADLAELRCFDGDSGKWMMTRAMVGIDRELNSSP